MVLAMTLYFMVYALIAKDREYIRMDFVTGRLSPTGKRVHSVMVRLGVLAFHGLVAWYAIRTTEYARMFETPILGWGEWVYYFPLAVGCTDIVITELIYLAWQLRGIEVADGRAEILT